MKQWLLTALLVALTMPGAYAETTDEANKKILKDALIGAVTGAVSAEATKITPADEAPTFAADSAIDNLEDADKNKRHHDKKHKHGKKNFEHKDKKRPHGWDMGKKTGWGDRDIPPGLAKRERGEDSK